MKNLLEIYFDAEKNQYHANVNFTYKDKEATDVLMFMRYIYKRIIKDYEKYEKNTAQNEKNCP